MQIFLSASLSTMTGHAKTLPIKRKIPVTAQLVNTALVLDVLTKTLCVHNFTTVKIIFSEFRDL